MQSFVIYSNSLPNGDHEVHNTTTGCTYMPLAANRIELGNHLTCQGAVALAKQHWSNERINGCFYCCKGCHTS